MPVQFGFVYTFYIEAIVLSHKTPGALARRLNKQSTDVVAEAVSDFTTCLQIESPTIS